MFFDILKKDLRRGKTMNTIILLFIILSVMFIASSTNSIVAVTSSLDKYFEKAGVPEIMAAAIDKAQPFDIEKLLENDRDLYNRIDTEELFFVDGVDIHIAGDEKNTFHSGYIVEALSDYKEVIFDENNEEITNINKGEIYVVKKCMDENNIKVGDTLVIKVNDIEKEFKVAGLFKDAILGPVLMGNARFAISDEDKDEIFEEAMEAGMTGKLYLFHTDREEELTNRLNEIDASFVFLGNKSLVKSAYIMDMMVAIILMVVSLILIIVALIVLRFTIGFTISSEFREIGVMKAIGIGNRKIRSIYITKYFVISVVASLIGTILSIPFGNMITEISSGSIMIESQNNVLISIICAIFTIIIIMLFCIRCTKKANKLSPVDAIRSGQSGERFRKKGFLHLSKSRAGATTFLAGNDILSAPRRYLIIIVVFALAVLPIQFLDIVASSLSTKEMLVNLGCVPSDAGFSLKEDTWMYTTDGSGKQVLLAKYKDIEKRLEEAGIPGKVYSEIMLTSKQEFNGKTTKVLATQGLNVKAEDHVYTKGSAPANKDEVAIQPAVAEALGADIGDVITVTIGDKKFNLMVSGLFEAMINTGQSIRIHEDLDVDYNYSNGTFGHQITFDDHPSEKVVKERLKTLEEIIPEGIDFVTGAEQANGITEVGPMFTTLKKLFFVLSIAIVIMVSLLMERSMIIKETGEIATLKAIGFTDNKIVKWHAKRFIITSVISAVIAGVLALPLTKLSADPIFAFMGVKQGVKYSFSIPRVCIVYPLLMVVFMTITIWIASLHTRKITAQETSCIE